MKYSIQIVCAVLGALTPVTIEAENDKSAVDQARVLPIPHSVTGGPDYVGDDPAGAPPFSITELDKPTPFHVAPLEGGDYQVVVTCLDSCPALVWDPVDNDHKPGTRPAGFVVSTYRVTHQPHEAVREAVEAKRAEAAEQALLAEKRDKLKEELRKEILAEQAAASGKAVQS